MKKILAVVWAAMIVFAILGPAFAATANVTISDNQFAPAAVTVTVGDTVNWSYPTGATEHSVTSRPNQSEQFDSSTNCPPACITPGGAYSFKFTKTGKFTYYCKIHGSPSGQCAMCGTVTVKSAATPQPTQTLPPVHTTAPPHHTTAPTAKPAATPRRTTGASPSPTHSPAQKATPLPTDDTRGVVAQTGAPLGSPIAFGEPHKSNRGPLIGLGIAVAGIALAGGVLLWYRLRNG